MVLSLPPPPRLVPRGRETPRRLVLARGVASTPALGWPHWAQGAAIEVTAGSRLSLHVPGEHRVRVPQRAATAAARKECAPLLRTLTVLHQ